MKTNSLYLLSNPDVPPTPAVIGSFIHWGIGSQEATRVRDSFLIPDSLSEKAKAAQSHPQHVLTYLWILAGK